MRLFFVLTICLCLLFLPQTGFMQDDDESAIRETLADFCTALQQRNVAKVEDAFPKIVVHDWKLEFENGYYAENPVKSCFIRSVSIEGAEASARLYVERLDREGKRVINDFSLNHFITILTRTVSGWKIVRNVVAENDLIDRLLAAPNLDVRKAVIRGESDLDIIRSIDVLLFRLKNEGKYELAEEYIGLAEWWSNEFCNGSESECFVNARATVLNARAANCVSQGDYKEALRYYSLAEKVTEDFRLRTGKVISGAVLTQINIGQLYFKEGNHEQAERFARLALKSLERLDRVEERVNYYYAHMILGDISAFRGDYDQAVEFYEKDQKPVSQGVGSTYLRQGKLNEAFQVFLYFAKKAELSVSSNKPHEIPLAIEAYVNLSEIHRQLGDTEKSYEAAKRAVEFATQTKDPELVYRARTAFGTALFAKEQFASAENEFRAAIDSVEKVRQNITGGEESRILFLENRVEPYHEMIDLLVARGNTQEALSFAERAKSRVLSEILQFGRTDWQAVLSGVDKEKERTLREKLSELNRVQTILKYQAKVDQPRLDAATRDLERVRLDYEFIKSYAYANYPELSRSRGVGTGLGTDEIVGLIRDSNSALLEFAVTARSVYLFVATTDREGKLDLRFYLLDGGSKEIIVLANEFRRRVVQNDLDYKASARKLHDVLLKKALPQIAGKTNLIIVPDAELWNVPFAGLIGDDGRFLVENRTLSYAQSLTALKELQKIRSVPDRGGGELLAFGNPRIDDKAIAMARSQFRSELGDLPEAGAEVAEIRKLYGKDSRFLTRLEAREDVWKAEAGKYRVLHLATHGVANSINPLYSYLFLSTSNSNTREDGLLEAWEIMNQRLNADLVVLSACETARGRIGKGEGLIGLSWAFAVANVPRIVASQWKVESKGTANLMVDFHRTLQSRLKPTAAESLRRAMLTQLRKPGHRHPFYWTGFIIIGSN